jgi:hypothetical protein
MHSVIKQSLGIAFAVVTGASTIASLCDYSLRKAFPNLSLWLILLILLGGFAAVFVCSLLAFRAMRHRGYETKINGKPVAIMVGDLFKQDGFKVIPFNERFDTQVDDVIVAHRTLNGIMIDKYVVDKDKLIDTIDKAKSDASRLKPNKKGIFPLGRLIAFEDFLMLAFTHFDEQNVAYIHASEYEKVLLNMWEEMRRVYAGREISLPLIGSGITTLVGRSVKDYTNLLKCILCTLDRSNFQPVMGVKIVLTKEAIKQINMNRIKEQF